MTQRLSILHRVALCLMTGAWMLSAVAMAQGTVAFQTRQTWTFAQDGVSFSNDFSGARLNGVTRTAANTYRLSITPEVSPINDSPWYAFKIWAPSQRQVTLTLVYTGGTHRYSPKVSVNNGASWVTLTATQNTDGSEATFTGNASSTVRLYAGQPMVTIEGQNAWADGIAQIPFVTSSIIGQSVQGRPIRKLETNTAPASDSQTLILMTGQHPAEVTGVLAFRLFVETLMADTPLARQFRRRFNIVMYPLMNPDGWYNGHWRTNANGFDTNHTWIDQGSSDSPEVQSAIASILATPNPAAFIDFHSTSTNVFYTGTDDAETPTYLVPEFLGQVAQRVPDWLWGRSINESGEGASSRSWIAMTLGIASMTWEWSDTASQDRLTQAPVAGAQAMMELLLDLWGGKPTPAARYDFETSTALGTDTTGAHPASLVGSPAYSTNAAIGTGSVSLSASSSSLSVPDFDYGSSGTTLSFWFRMTSSNLASGDFTYLFSHGDSTTANSFNIYHRKPSSTLRIRVRDADDTTNDIDIADSAVMDSVWHHLAVVVAPAGTSVYLDGKAAGTSINGNNGINPTGAIRIGVKNDGDITARYRGLLDDVRIHAGVLTQYQLTMLRHRDAPAEPYMDWKSSAFTNLLYGPYNPQAADGVDADGDGLTTAMEHALGGNPLQADRQLVEPKLLYDAASKSWYFQHRRRRGGSGNVAAWTAGSEQYRVSTSTNLANWSSGASALPAFAAPTVIDANFESATYKAPAGAAKRFYRLETTRTGN